MVLSADPDYDPSPLAIVGAAAALAISDIPFPHVLGGIRVGMVNGQLVVNPSYEEGRTADFSIVVAGTEEGIVMVEAGGNGVVEEDVVRCIEFGHDCCRKIIAGIKDLASQVGTEKRTFTPAPLNQELFTEVTSKVRADLADALDTKKHGKIESYSRISELKKNLV